MSQVFPGDELDAADEQSAEDAASAVRTGDPAIDEVLDAVDALADTPVDEHVVVFERAHEQLRRALDAGS